MINRKITKFATLAVGMTFVFGVMATPAGAQTVAELQAQINALMAQLAALSGGSAPVVSATFSSNLTLGSRGTEVTSLQQVLVAGGYLVMPAGVSYGYFGGLTQAALAKWQAANGVAPAAGYWGPISRAKYVSMSPGTPGSPVTPGTPAGITTPGVEGTVTVTLGASPSNGTKLYEGDEMEKVLAIELEAKTSDIRIERLKLDLDCVTCTPGSDSDFYRKIADKVYVMDGSTVLGSMDLNTSTVVEDGSDRFVTIAGLNFIVPKGTEKTIYIALDAHSTWDSTYDGDSWSITVPAEGVRGVDGAGVNQYGPTTALSARTFTSQAEQADDATVTVSLNANTPQTADVICASGADDDECDGMELLRADFKAEDDAVTITDLVVDVTWSGAATSSTGYLYDGSTLISSDSIDTDGHSGFTFDDIDWVVSEDSTRTLTVKVDVDDAASTATTFLADIDTADVTAENSNGDSITEAGSATGETQTVRNIGAEFSLVSKSITKSSYGAGDYATSTAEGQFVIRATAIGGDVIFGDAGSTTVPFVSNAGGSHDDELSFQVYRGGSAVATAGASSTSVTVPGSGVSNVTANSFTLQEGNTVDISVSFVFEGKASTGVNVTLGSYAIGIAQLNWVSSAGIQESNFMAGESAWRTSTVSLP